jgi:hypothetical protein
MDPRRYGAIGNGMATNVTVDTAGLKAACKVAGVNGGVVKICSGVSLFCNTDINVPVGMAVAVDIEGAGWSQTGITFTGSAVKNGLLFAGSSYSYAGSVRDIAIRCMSGAVQCVTFTNCDKPLVRRSWLQGAAGCGASFSTCIMPVIEETLIGGCGSASFGEVEFVQCTTVAWRHSYISGANSGCIGGLLVDQCNQVSIDGGAIESCGTPILISSKSGATGCVGVAIRSIDLENPGNGNRFIDVGAGLSGGFVDSLIIEGLTASPSGTTSQPSGVRVQNTIGAECRVSNIGIAGTPGATYELAGTNNYGVHILPHRNLYGNSYPWVTSNGTQVKAAGPSIDWVLQDSPRGLANPAHSITGTTPSILITAQGGYYSVVTLANATPVSVSSLSGGESGMQVSMLAADGNSTLVYGTGAGQFATLAGANLTLGANKAYSFIHNGTCWVQH